MSRYVKTINGSPLAASHVVPDSPLDDMLDAIIAGSFQEANLTGGQDPVPDVQDPEPKVIYITPDPSDPSGQTKPHVEWIYADDKWVEVGTITPQLAEYVKTVDFVGTGNVLTSAYKEGNVLKFTRGTIDAATSTSAGLVKLGSDIVVTDTAEAITTASGRTYAVQANTAGQLMVNVPWTDAGSVLSWDTQASAYNPSSNPAATVDSINVRIADFENSGNKVTSWQSTPDDVHYPSEKLVKDSLDAKIDSVAGASGHFISFGSNGTIADSTYAPADFAHSVKVYNSSTELNVNGSVTIPSATLGDSASPGDYGVVQIECIEI